jgi:signal transduction histidine kinase
MVAITVEDSGQGISDVDLPFVFDKFYRARSAATESAVDNEFEAGTATPGVGLGLYLAQRVVNQLEGKIVVKSAPGRGTIFTILLPQSTADDKAETDDEEVTNAEAIVSG